jgi:hypothetical protein
LALLTSGCNEDPVAPENPTQETCTLQIVTPQSFDIIRARIVWRDWEDLMNIRWNSTEGGVVRIDLFKGTDYLLTITPETQNDGFFAWHAAVGNLSTGIDYQVEVTSLAPLGCKDMSPEFTVVEYNDCGLAASVQWPGSPSAKLNEDAEMTIFWAAEGGCGQVEIQLWRANFEQGHEFVRPITTLANEFSPYIWKLGDFNLEATGPKECYYVRVSDNLVKDCSTMCSYFEYD